MKRTVLHILMLLCLPLCATAAQYHCSRVTVPLGGGDSAAGYLLVPENDTSDSVQATGLPAVLLLHDHGAWFAAGKEKLVSPQAIEEAEHGKRTVVCAPQLKEQIIDRFYAGAYLADTLASLGYVVLCVDALYWGERAVSLPDAQADDKALKEYNSTLKDYQPSFYSVCLKKYGKAWYEKVLADDKACVTYLLSLPCVDKARIACFGFSFGAYRSWQLAAEDNRIAVCAAANWMTTKKANGGPLPNVSAYSMFRPAVPYQTDYPDIASLIAPRPFLLVYGTHDRLFSLAATQECAVRIAEAYKKSDSETLFRAAAFDEDHCFGAAQRKALTDFLKDNL